jgi:FkbM family methyltransferase
VMTGTRDSHNYRADFRALLGLLARYGITLPPLESEHRIVPSLLQPGNVVLDVGANVGVYTFQFSRVVGSGGRVIAYEPYLPSASRVQRISRLLRFNNVTVVQTALTNETATIRLCEPSPAPGGRLDAFVHLANPSEIGSIPVQSSTIDMEAQRLGLPALDFIKCDVEGAEWMVFDGSRQTISKFHPLVLCEIEDRWARRYGHTRDEVIQLIQSLSDYRTYVLEGGHLVELGGCAFDHINYFFISDREAGRFADILG